MTHGPFDDTYKPRSNPQFGNQIVSIGTGSPNNEHDQTSFGLESDDFSFLLDSGTALDDNFLDASGQGYGLLRGYNPVDLLGKSQVGYSVFTFNSQCLTSNGLLNGVIEPLTIRDIVSFNSLYYPYEPHTVLGSVQSGNEAYEIGRGSDYVVSIDSRQGLGNVPYLDFYENDLPSGRPAGGTFIHDSPKMSPFVDTSTYDLVKSYVQGGIQALTGTIGQEDMGYYFGERDFAFSSGFTYDAALPVDSLAFGGMIYR